MSREKYLGRLVGEYERYALVLEDGTVAYGLPPQYVVENASGAKSNSCWWAATNTIKPKVVDEIEYGRFRIVVETRVGSPDAPCEKQGGVGFGVTHRVRIEFDNRVKFWLYNLPPNERSLFDGFYTALHFSVTSLETVAQAVRSLEKIWEPVVTRYEDELRFDYVDDLPSADWYAPEPIRRSTTTRWQGGGWRQVPVVYTYDYEAETKCRVCLGTGGEEYEYEVADIPHYIDGTLHPDPAPTEYETVYEAGSCTNCVYVPEIGRRVNRGWLAEWRKDQKRLEYLEYLED